MQKLHTLYRNTKSKLEGLRVKTAQATSDSGVQLDEQMHTDMMSMVESSSSEVESLYPEGSFQRKSVQSRVGPSKKEKTLMLLSSRTLLGLRITGWCRSKLLSICTCNL